LSILNGRVTAGVEEWRTPARRREIGKTAQHSWHCHALAVYRQRRNDILATHGASAAEVDLVDAS
jgi:hypothetical protein